MTRGNRKQSHDSTAEGLSLGAQNTSLIHQLCTIVDRIKNGSVFCLFTKSLQRCGQYSVLPAKKLKYLQWYWLTGCFHCARNLFPLILAKQQRWYLLIWKSYSFSCNTKKWNKICKIENLHKYEKDQTIDVVISHRFIDSEKPLSKLHTRYLSSITNNMLQYQMILS